MTGLEGFYNKVPNAESLTKSENMDYFAYYLEVNNKKITTANLQQCFAILALPAYANISSYLSRNLNRKTDPKFVKHDNEFKLSREFKKKIAQKLNDFVEVPATNDLIDLGILESAPSYVKKNAEQMCKCYDYRLYDATLVLMRKLIETLIIETFERRGIEDKIKHEGEFMFLSKLIPLFESSDEWTVGRGTRQSLKNVKKYGDLSAHDRRFLARKSHLDSLKADLMKTIEEVIHIIDYPNWHREKSKKK